MAPKGKSHEIYLTPPSEQKLWSLLSTCLNSMGAIDRRLWGFPQTLRLVWLSSLVMRVCGPFYSLLQILFLVNNRRNLRPFQLQNITTNLPVSVIMNVKLLIPHRERFQECMKAFFHKVHVYHFKSDSYVEKKIIEVESNTRLLCKILTAAGVVHLTVWSFIPIYLNKLNAQEIANGTMGYQTGIYMWMPFDYCYSFTNWAIMHVMSIYILGSGCIPFLWLDGINYIVIFHLIAHIQILKHKIQNVCTIFHEGNDEEIRVSLVKLIENTAFVIESFLQMEAAFAPNVALNYFFNLSMDCVMVYNIMVYDATRKALYGAYLLVFIGGLVVLSVIIEQLHYESSTLPDALYDLPWECLSVKNRKMFLILLMMCQRSLKFRASGGLHAGLQPMINIFKSTFSFYTILRSRI